MSDYMRPGVPKSDPSLLRLQLVGPMQARTLDNASVLPPGRKTRGLLAILAMSGRRPVLRSKLAEMLWSRRSEEQARASLRQEIHRLLDALAAVGAPVVSVERHALALRPALTVVDAERLLNANVNQVIAQATAQANLHSSTSLTGAPSAANTLPPLDGVLLEELNGTDPALDLWLASERRRLREHALALYEAALERSPESVAAIGIARQLLLLDPLHEAAWRGLIRTQLLQGDRGAALQSAERCAALFASRAAAEPGPETGRLLAELRANLATQAAEPVPTAAEPALAGSLEASPSSLAPPAEIGIFEEDPVVSINGRRLHDRSLATLAVLPPLDLDAGANDKLVPALSDELVAGLARSPMLALVSGSMLAQALAQGRDDALLRRNFGLDYVLDGSVLRGRNRIRVILRLLDLRLQGHVVWASRYDCDPSDPMQALDGVIDKVCAQLPWELLLIESRRLGARPVADLTATQLALRAVALAVRAERAANDKAGELLQRAAALDPDNPLGIYVEAMRHLVRAVQFWGDFESEARLAERAIGKALAAGRLEPTGIAVAGVIRGHLLGDPKLGLALIDRALAIAPHLSIEQTFAAFLLVRLGEHDEARRRFDRYKAMSPLHPLHALFDGIGVTIALLQGRLEEAAELGSELTELSPGLLHPAISCLAAFGHLGMRPEAERLLARIQILAPGLGAEPIVAQMRLLRETDRECLLGGLRAAGMADAPSLDADLGVRLAT